MVDGQPFADHPHTDPGDGRKECQTCGKWVRPVLHSCKGVPVTIAAQARRDRTASALRVIQQTADTQGNVTMLRLAERLADDATLVRLAQAEGWDAAVQEAEDCGLLNGAFATEIRERNPYRDAVTPPGAQS